MKLAFVIPWYGAGIPGGAEAEVRRTAERLAAAGAPVEVLATCIRDLYADWSSNYHRPGLSVENGVPVRRFAVGQRNREAFDAVNLKLMHGLPVNAEEEDVFWRENVNSAAMLDFISCHLDEYVFIFIPYLFGTTYEGLQACQGRGLLIPCLHDEGYARLRRVGELLGLARRLIFHSPAEQALAERLYLLQPGAAALLGEGVDTGFEGDPGRFRARYGVEGPIILYAGRKDPGKNVDLLIDYFARYRSRRRAEGRAPCLVLIGGGPAAAAVAPGARTRLCVRDLGFLPPQDKYDALQAATVLCQPSLTESFSLILMEAWAAGTPALVHAGCAVTWDHCVRSRGGLCFSGYDEFAACLDLLLQRPGLAARLGQNGRAYVLANYGWEAVIERYLGLLREAGVTRSSTDGAVATSHSAGSTDAQPDPISARAMR